MPLLPRQAMRGLAAPPRIAIIGAGIGGLATAIALRQRGVRADVFEAAETLRPVGAGILMQPNAMTVLARLGLADAVTSAGITLERAGIWDAGDLAGGPLQEIDMSAIARRHGTPTVALLRSALQDVLLAALDEPPRLGQRCVRVEGAGEPRPRIRFASGDIEEADVIIAADGINSAVRGSVFPDRRLRYSGQTSWRGIVDMDPATEPDVAYEYWTGGFRLGYARVAPRRTYWFTALDAREGERGDAGQELAMLRARSRAFPAHIEELLARTDPSAVVRNDLHDLMPVRGWSRGSIVLLGDAGHATTPNIGQGGAQALEDALALADAIAAHGPGARAFAEYERVRRAKAALIVRASWMTGKIGHWRSSFARRVRNAAMRRIPRAILMRQMDTMYTVAEVKR
jgi:2-polyprenyl-6-methoxyphenol hydroxylase-like FAD-dependent oxidoreductase